MKPGSKPLTRKPGEFYGICNLTKPHPIKDLPLYLQREYAEKGWPKGWRNVYSRKAKRGLNTECFLEPRCEGFETADRAAFDAHMRDEHGKREVRGYWESVCKSVRAGWRPSLSTRRDIAAAHELKTCTSCGMAAEVGQRAADVLWWDEHERLCTGQAVAS